MKRFFIVIGALAIALPSIILNPVVPLFIYCALFAVGYIFYRSNKPERKLKPYLLNFIWGFCTLFVLVCGGSIAEKGLFNFGPFYAQELEPDFARLQKIEEVGYRNGNLVSLQSPDSIAVLSWVVDNSVVWAVEFKNEKSKGIVSEISSMKISEGLLRDRVDFYASGWEEPGHAYIFRFGGFQKYYLKNF